MSAFPNGSNSNLDNLLLQTMMGRLQLRAPINNPLVTQSLEDFLFNDLDEDDAEEESFEGKSELAREEAKLEKEVIKIILSGNGESLLKPNSGQAVSVRDHHICVGFQDEEASGYRVWEWHGHIMAFDEEFGYNPEYIYGNYFQWFKPRPGGASAAVADPVVKKEEEEEKQENQGLRELIETKDSADVRILHRNINAASPGYKIRIDSSSEIKFKELPAEATANQHFISFAPQISISPAFHRLNLRRPHLGICLSFKLHTVKDVRQSCLQ